MAVVRYVITEVHDDGNTYTDVYESPEFVFTGLMDDDQRVLRIVHRSQLIGNLDDAIERMRQRNG